MTYKYHLRSGSELKAKKNEIDNQNRSFRFNYRFKSENRYTTTVHSLLK